LIVFHVLLLKTVTRARRGRNRMIVGFPATYAISTKVVSSNPVHDEVYSRQHYVIKIVSDWRQVDGLLHQQKLTAIKKYASIKEY
jgi:hypothetical protein